MTRTFALVALALVAAPALAGEPSELLADLSGTLDGLDAVRCAAELDAAFAELSQVDGSLDAAFVASHPGAAAELWRVQRQAESTLHRLHGEGPVDEPCVDAFRRVDLALRYGLDHVLLGTPDASPWSVTGELAGFGDLRSGDVLVSRGGALSSAGIAHIGAVDTAFSHNAMVYVDPQGQAWTVEAYLEKGGLVQPLEDFLAHGIGRVAVVRYEDEAFAARAAHLAWQRMAHGPAIPYDEAFDDSEHGELFCSEIVPWAFSMAGGPPDVPLHRTRFDHQGTPELFAGMGVVVADLAAPADLMVDPRFRVVGEWRDLHALPTLHRQDAVVDGLFRWMAAERVSPQPTWTHRATVDVGLAVRRTPVLGRVVKERVHPDGDRQFLVTALALQDACQRLYDVVEAEIGGAPVPRGELDARIDTLLAADARSYARKPSKGAVHHVLRGGDESTAALSPGR